MSKELEALETIKLEFGCDPAYYNLGKEFETIKQALERLEAIDNAEPTKALECLERIKTQLFGYFKSTEARTDDVEDYEKLFFEPIKQALLKAEKEHNSLNLLMQELDCKDFADLRKYARCGYEKINKQYLKWEDLEFKEAGQKINVKLEDSKYTLWCRKVKLLSNLVLYEVTLIKEKTFEEIEDNYDLKGKTIDQWVEENGYPIFGEYVVISLGL